MQEIQLLPMPRKLVRAAGSFAPTSHRNLIQLDPDTAAQLINAAKIIQSAARESLGAEWEINAARRKADGSIVDVQIQLGEHAKEQHSIDISPDRIDIRATSAAMAFYAAHTVAQLLRQ